MDMSAYGEANYRNIQNFPTPRTHGQGNQVHHHQGKPAVLQCSLCVIDFSQISESLFHCWCQSLSITFLINEFLCLVCTQLKANYCVFVSVQNAIPNDDGRVWMMVLPSRFKFHAALLSFPHEYSFQITHTACLMPMVMETTISCKLKPYEEEEEGGSSDSDDSNRSTNISYISQPIHKHRRNQQPLHK